MTQVRDHISSHPVHATLHDPTTNDHAHAAHSNPHGNPDHASTGGCGAGPTDEAGEIDRDDHGQDSDDESEADAEEETRLGPIEQIKQRLRAKQQQWMDERRDPLLEWKEEERWKREHEAYRVAADEARRQLAALEEAKQATKEQKQKRKAQHHATKQKAREFRETLYHYEVDVVKSETRAQLISVFQRQDRQKQKRALVEAEEIQRQEEERVQERQLEEALATDEEKRRATDIDVDRNIGVADEMGRRCGMLPAIHTPPTLAKNAQDETSSLLILRINTATPNPIALTLPPRAYAAGASSNAKRQVFTVNIKRFKHVEEITGEAIGDPGGVELARALLTGACPRVKTIRLGWNHLKYSSIVALADCFVRGAGGQLQVLDLRFNTIDATCVVRLIEALDQGGLPELHELIFQGNVIGDDGAKAFAHAMLRGTLKLLRVLDIRQNRIRNAGVLALWNVFTSESVRKLCPKLQLLDMRRNDAQASVTRSFLPCPPYLEF